MSFGDAEQRSTSLDGMLAMFTELSERILGAMVTVDRRIGNHEFLFADSGVSAIERWSTSNIPFRIHAPLTPDISINVIPLPFPTKFVDAPIAEATNEAVGRANRVILGSAKRFVFSRTSPNIDFIRKNFGVPPPNDIASRAIHGSFEARWATAEELKGGTEAK